MPSAREGMSEFNRKLGHNPSTAMENGWGQWVPAIPLPHYLLKRYKCACGAKFWTMDGYRGHYALRHILDPD